MKQSGLFVLFLICGLATTARTQVTTGTISGTVKDRGGLVLPGTTIQILNSDTGITRTVVTGASGEYSAPSLSLGQYSITATHTGFETEVRSGIILTVGREAIVDMELTVGSVSETVVVTGEAPLVETTSGGLGSLVDGRTMRALPLNGRSYDQLAELQPGVIRTNQGVSTNTQFTFGSGERFSVGGQRTYSNSFLLDGTNIDDQGNGTPGGAAGLNLGMDTMEEFKIFTNSFKAEYGYATGSVTSVATRTGTNHFHGTIFEYTRNSVLDAENFFDLQKHPFRRNQFGGVLGGPIRRDRTFFFVGYEGLRQGQETSTAFTVPTALARQGILPYATVTVSPAIMPYLNLYPLPNGRDFGDGSAQYVSAPNQITNDDNYMGRVDQQLSAKSSIFGRYILDQDIYNVPQGIAGEYGNAASRRQYLTLQATNIFTSALVNNVRFAFNRTRNDYSEVFLPANNPANNLSFVPGQPLGALNVGGSTASAGTRAIAVLGFSSGNGNLDWAYNIFELGDDFTLTKGRHTVKIGGDFQRLQDNVLNSKGLRGTYTFTSLSTFLQGIPSVFQADSPFGVSPEWGVRQLLYAAYAQDDYKLSSRVTLNLGLRWETTTNPTDVNKKMAVLTSPAATATTVSNSFFTVGKKNFEPRFGIAWQLDSSGKTALRAGAGIYHNLIYPWLYGNILEIPPYFKILTQNNPTFPNAYTTLNTGLVALGIVGPVEKTPANYQFNISFQREIINHTVLQVSYEGTIGNHNQLSYEADTAVPTYCGASPNNCPAGVPNGTIYYPTGSSRINPAWAGERIYSNTANSSYNGGTALLRRQFTTGLQGQFFYTYSKSLDIETATGSSDSARSPNALLNPFNPKVDWGPSDFDSRNDFGFSFTYALPFKAESRIVGFGANGWTVDGIGTFFSGEPITARLANSVSRDLSSTLADRPNLNPGFSNNPTHGTTGTGCTGIPGGIKLGGPVMFYNPCAFSDPIAGTYGNVGRNTIVGPSLHDVDFALEKGFRTTERITTTFRAEVFNGFNRPNFGIPNTTAVNSQGTGNASAGVCTYTITNSRQIQFGLRVAF